MLYYGLSLNASNLGNKYKLLILSLQQQKMKLSIFLQENDVVVQIAFFNCFLLARPFFQKKILCN